MFIYCASFRTCSGAVRCDRSPLDGVGIGFAGHAAIAIRRLRRKLRRAGHAGERRTSRRRRRGRQMRRSDDRRRCMPAVQRLSALRANFAHALFLPPPPAFGCGAHLTPTSRPGRRGFDRAANGDRSLRRCNRRTTPVAHWPIAALPQELLAADDCFARLGHGLGPSDKRLLQKRMLSVTVSWGLLLRKQKMIAATALGSSGLGVSMPFHDE